MDGVVMKPENNEHEAWLLSQSNEKWAAVNLRQDLQS